MLIEQAADKEINVIRTIIKYISKYRLESKFSPKELEKQISELENLKREKVHQRTSLPIASVSCGESTRISTLNDKSSYPDCDKILMFFYS